MFKSYEEMLEELEKEMRRLSDDMLLQAFRVSGRSSELWAPRVDVYETADAVVAKVCAAGLDPDKIDLTLSADVKFLTLRGLRIERDDDRPARLRYHQLEIYYGPFERVVALPVDVPVDRDKLSATYRDGFLKVVMPKSRQSALKKIEIED